MSNATSTDATMSDLAEEAQARVGTKLNAKWTIDGLLGVGGMGAVFAATHRNGSRKAIKLLHGSLVQDKEVRARFLREAMIANKIDHPARVAIIDDDVSDQGELFIVMELLEGKSLFQVRREAGGIMMAEHALEIFDVVLDLLDKAHIEGIIHRDIKPGNIFITDAGEVKVLDFGIARMRDAAGGQELTQAGAALGTPSYVSPEQARGLIQLIDGRTDSFSVGACLYTAVSGVRLHEGRSDAEAMVLAATAPAPSLAAVAPAAPVELVALIDRALSFERDRRFPNALAMQAELRDVLSLLRSGNATIAKEKAPSTAKKRANVELDAPDWGESEADKAQILEKLAFAWKQVQITLKEVRHVGWTHPQTQRAFKTAFGRLGELVSLHPTCVQWIVTPAGFEQSDVPLWTPDRMPFDRVPYQLFADGVRRIQFKEGLNEEEFRDFIGLLSMLATVGLPPGDDSVTFLWDKRFEYIAYEAVDALVRSDDERADIEDIYQEVLAGASHDTDGTDLEARAMQKNISELLQGVTGIATDCSIDPLTRAALGAQCQGVQEDEWWGRFADCFERGFDEAREGGDLEAIEDPVHEWSRDHIAFQNYEEVFRVFGRLSDATARDRSPEDAEELLAQLSRMLVGTNVLKELLLYLTKEGQQQTQDTPPELPDELVTGLRAALKRLGSGELFGLAAGCFGAMRERKIRPVLFEYMRRWTEGRDDEMGQMGVTAGVALGTALVKLLAERKEAGQRALETMMSNANLEVRIEAMAALTDEDRVRLEVRNHLQTATESSRMECLKLVAKRGLTAAGAVLVVRVQNKTFHGISEEEKRAFLETIMKLNPRRGAATAVKLVGDWRLIPRPRMEETRRLACEVLATCPLDEDSQKALTRATSGWWWNSQSVRTAARAALDRTAADKQLPEKAAEAPAAKPAAAKAGAAKPGAAVNPGAAKPGQQRTSSAKQPAARQPGSKVAPTQAKPGAGQPGQKQGGHKPAATAGSAAGTPKKSTEKRA